MVKNVYYNHFEGEIDGYGSEIWFEYSSSSACYDRFIFDYVVLITAL